MQTLFTIGHSGHDLEHFLALLRRHQIEVLVDVRSHPYSRHLPHYRRDALRETLVRNGIEYLFLGRELGGRPTGDEFHVEGRLIVGRRAGAPELRQGLSRLLLVAQDRRVVIMCAEEDPGRCHRTSLIGPALAQEGATVIHIRGDGRLQAGGEDRQLPLFEDDQIDPR